ncbi:hypothetical protein [Nostoc sp. ATCC 53789]|jgi:hypothetical protein|uniref:hypothetical protein n=2 Tax=unclassified Nostoc TaxID=2593658 RepID=UPI0011BE1315|nr:hypothetical protein [Nostoc sp. ATCC 53789]MBD2508084.1 hypothetical protein [Desmonostoc muscorum FACHB-395]QHG18322.1 hypothetical protein GJB62_21665 [Nostoc sp. ATCC 53789]
MEHIIISTTSSRLLYEMLCVACFDLGVYGSLRQALRVDARTDARSSLTLRYRYRYANAVPLYRETRPPDWLTALRLRSKN